MGLVTAGMIDMDNERVDDGESWVLEQLAT